MIKSDEGGRQLSERAHAISSRAGRVFDRLDRHADDTGRCWPSQQTLAAALHVSVRTIRRATRELEAARIIDVVPGKNHRPSVYQIHYREAATGEDHGR